ncbi:C25 family cysteine peptidase [Jatrophihabitans sp.]|uniref:C25 family cysteine peptidase n=1 Tax=Jatrophihabitans sp. TaxID=1932789 RepID=UPI002C2AE30D|nr:C25 family cysteine peptidase [Jatrophihabitans sp.]
MRCHSEDHESDAVSVTLHFGRDELTVTPSPFGLVVRLAGVPAGGEPGAPALPRTQVRIAVPEPFWPHTLEVEDSWETVVEKDAFVRPVQHLRPGIGSEQSREPEHAEAVHCSPHCSCRARQRPIRHPLTQGLPAPEVVPPDERRYEAAATDPLPPARAVRIETIGTTHVAVVEINPVRIGPRGELRLCTSLRLRVGYARTAPLGDQRAAHKELSDRLGREIDLDRVVPEPAARLTGGKELERLLDIAASHVLNPKVLDRADARLRWPVLDLPCEYLIVTDDCSWDATTFAAGAPVPGLVAAFERLAAAKRARGVSARVVTITDIVAGRYGDVRTGSRDLQEAIRKFLKIARRRWGTSWLLLGGDTSVVPVRSVAGSFEGHVEVGTNATPENNKSYWAGSHLKMHVVNPGVWWGASVDNRLVRPDTGQLIPYDSTGMSNSASPGWYFTASDYTTRSTMPTNFVRVNGPASLLNATLQFLYHWNTLPTDFYYASLDSWLLGQQQVDLGWFSFTIPFVYLPDHDWDVVGNGLYGQHLPDGTDLDGVLLRTDLSVGRAPVDSAAQANTFVDKVLAYEGLRNGSISLRTSRWPARMVLASSDWGGRSWFGATSHTVPGNGEYHHDASTQTSLLKRDGAPESFDYELIAHVSDTDRRVLPFKTNPSATVRGWYFATSAADLSPRQISIPLPWSSPVVFPLSSEWIVVHGPLAEQTPAAFEFDPSGQDGSMADQEALRSQIRSELPGIDEFQRLYEDEYDLSFAQRVAAPVDYLTSGTLTGALNAGPHFVSLSGHGNSDGCCGGSVGLARGLTNGSLGFIGYADSCLTNQFDTSDAFSEELITNPHGGATGYVGNTRFSWIGVGDNFQRAFFHRLTATRHLGLLNDSRVTVFGTTGYWAGYERWAIFTLNLLGDPELQVYREPVRWRRLEVDLGKLDLDLGELDLDLGELDPERRDRDGRQPDPVRATAD